MSRIKYHTITKTSEECICSNCPMPLYLNDTVYISELGNWYCSYICYKNYPKPEENKALSLHFHKGNEFYDSEYYLRKELKDGYAYLDISQQSGDKKTFTISGTNKEYQKKTDILYTDIFEALKNFYLLEEYKDLEEIKES